MLRSHPQRPRAAARLAMSQAAHATIPAAIHSSAAAIPALLSPVPIGVGIDTSRYGHYASFLRTDLQPAAADLKLVESAAGYQQLGERLEALASKHGGHVHFHFRLDLAGRYADNLLAFLHRLPYAKTISCGDPQRNKNYRVAIYGAKKSDPIESAACARYALTEKPKPTADLTPALRLLCQIASRLESQSRHDTRLINQLHNLLARTFPELALLIHDLSAGWVLDLLDRYPTAAKLASARSRALERIPYLPHQHIPMLLQHAKDSVACLSGPAAEELVRALVRQIKEARVLHKSLEKLLEGAYRQLPFNNHLDSIPGFGPVTAAILTAKIVDPHRFLEPGKLVGHFGVFPVEASSGIDRDGKPRLPRRMIMSKRGNDLVRRYLWMAALSAAQHNPAVGPLYQRVRAKHPDRPSIAIGHAMRKLLHLALAVWKSGKPFDPEHYPWGQAPQAPQSPPAQSAPAAGHKHPAEPGGSVVTAAGGIANLSQAPAPSNTPAATDAVLEAPDAPPSDIPLSQVQPTSARPWIDFEHLKSQLPLQRLLQHLDLWTSLNGSSPQRRGPCPVHAPSGKPGAGKRRGRTFSVQLDNNVFQCFDKKCAIHGDVIDLWAAVKGLKLRDAALELLTIFNLEPAPTTEKRHG